MPKIGISIKLDVKKLDKARFFAAQSGALYVDLTMFLDPDNEGTYGDHGFITQSTSKEEREQGVQMPILGNGKIFYGLQDLQGGQQPQSAPQQQRPAPQQAPQQRPQQAPQQRPAQQQPQQNQQAPQQNFTPDLDDGWDDYIPF